MEKLLLDLKTCQVLILLVGLPISSYFLNPPPPPLNTNVISYSYNQHLIRDSLAWSRRSCQLYKYAPVDIKPDYFDKVYNIFQKWKKGQLQFVTRYHCKPCIWDKFQRKIKCGNWHIKDGWKMMREECLFEGFFSVLTTWEQALNPNMIYEDEKDNLSEPFRKVLGSIQVLLTAMLIRLW